MREKRQKQMPLVEPAGSHPQEKEPVDHNGFVEVYGHPRAYWVVSQTAVVPPDQIKDGQLTLIFRGYLTGRKTEFWAIDNVRIKAEPAT